MLPQIKGELINLLLESIKQHLESLSPQQRYDVDSKAEALHKHWIELKDLVLKRVDYVSLLIEFFEQANELSSQLDNLQRQLQQTPDEHKLQFLQATWANIASSYAELKTSGQRFINLKVGIGIHKHTHMHTHTHLVLSWNSLMSGQSFACVSFSSVLFLLTADVSC